jgi:UDP-N-acetylglucosamine--N-acetylmuramyl-(pentapeptide) pyrophosphoryl-undecaprenol N-acetylglucosamine transferase
MGHLVIAGGGTGGHIFPGIAIAEAWKARGGAVTFVGTPQGQEGDIVPRYGFPIRLMTVGRLKGAGLKQKIKTFASLPGSILQARALLKELKPSVVLGIGGYASGPLVMAAKGLGIPTAITDQNAQPGMTNRILGKLVNKVFLSFEESEVFFPKAKIRQVGNPIRSEIRPEPYPSTFDPFHLFIFGGSQGAKAVNEAVLGALDHLQDLWPKLKITHQAGKVDFETVKAFYEQRKLPATVSLFFSDMHEQYAKAHLVICRSGAGTITELALSGRPAILVPYPIAADDHQTKNAQVFVKTGAAWLLPQKDLTPESLATQIRHLIQNPSVLVKHAEAMRKMARPDAAKRLVEELVLMAKE